MIVSNVTNDVKAIMRVQGMRSFAPFYAVILFGLKISCGVSEGLCNRKDIEATDVYLRRST